LNETVKILRKLTGYSGEVQYGPERTGDIKHSYADISRAKEALGYKPIVGFEEGLKKTVEWYRSAMVAKA
jgi:UDP-glucose 4-epimerase